MRKFFKKPEKAISFIVFVLMFFSAAVNAATFTVTKTADTNDGFCDADCSLREAVAAANLAVGTDTIVFDAAVFATPQTITLANGNLVITNSVNSNVTITGPGANLLTVSGNNVTKIFTILEAPVVVISGMTLTQGNGVGTAPGNNFGGAIYNQGDLTLNNVVVTNSSATNEGGGIYVSTSDSVVVNNCTISNNSADSVGGGIYGHSGATVNISNSTVSGNSSDTDGGGLFFQSNATVTDSTFTGNTAGRNGGGAYADDGATFNITNSTFSSNTAQTPSTNAGGGGLYIDSAIFNITDSSVINNISNLHGGGIALDVTDTTYTIIRTTITGNTATGNGGGVFIEESNLTFTDSTISGNTAQNGGGIYFFFNLPLSDTLTRLTISNNTATNNGGGIFVEEKVLIVENSTFTGNVAARNGGGVYADEDGTLTVTNSTFSGNTAQAASGGGGGGLYINEADFAMTDSTVRNNISNFNGGGILFVNVGAILYQSTINRSTISTNTATNNGGGMFNEGMEMGVTNSTFSGNSAANGGGLHYISTRSDELTLSYSTVAYNNALSVGGGVNVTNQPMMGNNTIFGNNTAGVAPDYNGGFFSGSYNLIENTTGAIITGNTTGNITGQDPMLSPLANFGGATQTHRLQLGSPAIDAANPTSFPATDQRGIDRPIDGNGTGGAQPDIGSFETFDPNAAFTVAGVVSDGFNGIKGARVVITDPLGNTRAAQTNSFGWFRFQEVPAGQPYVVEVFSKYYQFSPQIIFVSADITDLNFTAEPEAAFKR